MPQGCVRGPLLFTVYTSSLVNVLVAHGVDYHLYADDFQLYIQIENIPDAKERLTLLMSDIKIWMARRKLKLNEGKTEIIMLHFENTQLVPCDCAKNFVVLDSPLSFRPHIYSVVKTCNFHTRNLHMIRNFINRDNLLSVVHSLIVSKIEYCYSLHVGLHKVTLKKVQSILNRAAQLIYSLPPQVPTTPFLMKLHWLPVKARVEFKIVLLPLGP